jgi:hypothetical protein
MRKMDANNDQDSVSRRTRYRRRLMRVLSWPAAIVILVYFLFEDLFLSWLRPLFGLLGRLAPFAALGRALKRLPPYVALVVIAIPFILIEPVKVFSLFWIGVGHVISGAILLVLSYVVSLFVVERLFHVMQDQLLSIGWFAQCFALVMRAKAWAIDLARSTAIYRTLRPVAGQVGAMTRSVFASLKGRLGRIFARAG